MNSGTELGIEFGPKSLVKPGALISGKSPHPITKLQKMKLFNPDFII